MQLVQNTLKSVEIQYNYIDQSGQCFDFFVLYLLLNMFLKTLTFISTQS
ncbi:hypothetical protein [Candidatus Stoquefichus sp. SB1]|nr:hypothetical protein [Candidatus Stoquefichus sp. SB1]